MRLIIMRHGEAEHNIKQACSRNTALYSSLTDVGMQEVKQSIAEIPSVDKIYASPLVRTLQTAKLVTDKFSDTPIFVDSRIRELDSGKYEGHKDAPEMDAVRRAQVAGDYFIRFGDYGENKYDIESRLCDFLIDLRESSFPGDTIMIISHGTISSFVKRILGLHGEHNSTGKAQIYDNVKLDRAEEYRKKLLSIGRAEIKKRRALFNELLISDNLAKLYDKIIRSFNSKEFSLSVLQGIAKGLGDNLIKIRKDKSANESILSLICVEKMHPTL